MVLGLSKIELILAIFLVFYILGDFDTPLLIMDSFKSIYSSILLFGLVIYLFIYGNGIIFLLTCFALYKLISGIDNKRYQQSKEGFTTELKEGFTTEAEKIDEEEIPVVVDEREILEEEEKTDNKNKSNAVKSAIVTEAFTSALTETSLEKELIDNEAPIGKGSDIKYKSSNYKPMKENMIGASLA